MSKNLKLLLFGAVGLVAGTTLALVFPQSEGVAGTALMLNLSLSAALCGAAVPGVVKFESKSIRATGATVFFVLPWLVPASSLTAASSPDEEFLTTNASEDDSSDENGSDSADSTARVRPEIRIPSPQPAPERPKLRRPRTVFDSIVGPTRS